MPKKNIPHQFFTPIARVVVVYRRILMSFGNARMPFRVLPIWNATAIGTITRTSVPWCSASHG